MSIGRECIEFTCEVYAQVLEAAKELEDFDTSQLVKFISGLGSERLPKPRMMWKFLTNPSKEMTSTDIKGEKDWRNVSKRAVERHLKQLHDLHVIDRLPSKGQWGKRGTRASGSGYRSASRYTLNPLYTGNLLINEAIDGDSRRLLLLTQKLLLGMPGFRDCLYRITAWFFKVVNELLSMGTIINQIPEFELLLKGVDWNDTRDQLRNMNFLVFDEIFATGILKMKFPFSDEELPWQESFRLEVFA